MNKIILIVLSAVLCFAPSASGAQHSSADSKKEKTEVKKKVKKEAVVVFKVDLHCHNCVEKISQNVGFEKGVKDMDVDLKKGIVEIKYNPEKTSVEKLQKALEKLGYKAVRQEAKPLL